MQTHERILQRQQLNNGNWTRLDKYPTFRVFTERKVKALSYIMATSRWDLFITTPILLLWEAFNIAAITPRRLFVHMSTTVYLQLSEL